VCSRRATLKLMSVLPFTASFATAVSDLGFAGGMSKASQIGELDGKSILTPYLVTTRFERRRALAATLSDTLYAYDFLELFQKALVWQWQEYGESLRRSVPIPHTVFKAVELILESEAQAGLGFERPAHLGQYSVSLGVVVTCSSIVRCIPCVFI
jgi:hypothetical protein